MEPKAIFFLRHGNDIDHIAPIVFHWAAKRGLKALVVLWQGLNPGQVLYQRFNLGSDYRINFLSSLSNVAIGHISSFGSTSSAFSLEDWKLEECARGVFEQFTSPQDKVVVCIDNSYEKLPEIVTRIARERGYATVSLPHGTITHHQNHLLHVDDVGERIHDKRYCHPANMSDFFDLMVLPDKDFTGQGVPRPGFEDKVLALGSARYCHEWIETLSSFVPEFTPKGEAKGLKLVMYPRSRFYPIFWEEVARTIQIISRFSDSYLVVQHHTRENDFLNDLQSEYPAFHQGISNVEVVGYETPSASLNRWGDVFIDLGTSIVHEPLIMNKPVLEMEYLHALHSAVAHFLPETQMNCRDDLYRMLELFSKNKDAQFYNEKHRTDFIDQFIQCEPGSVLERYSQLLYSLAVKDEARTLNPLSLLG